MNNDVVTVDPLKVACPRCASAIGEPCIALSSASRDERVHPHPSRIYAARKAGAK